MRRKRILWLDDVRNPEDTMWKNWLDHQLPNKGPYDKVSWVKSYREFTRWIIEWGLPDVIAFDHDLGTDKTGYDAAKWVTGYCLTTEERLPDWVIQSSNPPGAENIDKLFQNFLKHKT